MGLPPFKKVKSLGKGEGAGEGEPFLRSFPPVQAFPRSLAMRNPVPRIAAIHDMSGFGRTSLTVAIPILSCMGIQVCPMPTAVLSTHTVEFTDYTLCDLTPELGGILDHWERLGLHFDGVYSGFMASPEQMDSVARCIRNCLAPGGLAVVDPVLGDNGILDPTMTPEMVEKMRWLISCADIITPNITEVALLLDEPFTPRISPEEIKGRLRRLSAMGPQTVVATSVPLLEGGRDPGHNASVIAYERDEDRFWRIDCAYIPAHYPGTGDTFSSVLTAASSRATACPSRWIAPSSSSPSVSGPRSGKAALARRHPAGAHPRQSVRARLGLQMPDHGRGRLL